ncbi:serine/threonine protein phosphatase [Tritrichomonas foetus]|uniref:Serine/threonine-protein phosphatase n=1 Tax=Tritrichomonas foetus TaxID=1144522 RepID=A0A1J4JM98_9EUKA|nr:serine/threonine protein phosphatase [Tritrichomonas foetus]|eukprot:OHS99817.1 serine/threonine protein phosphatase [Tritrichomonas foetus]
MENRDFLDRYKTSVLDKGGVVPIDVVTEVCLRLLDLLNKEDNIVLLASPITICGDVHGQYEDVIQLFKTAGNNFDQKFLFLGDYVDRGYYSLNTFLLLAMLKIKYPHQYTLLRGNHESRQTTMLYGLYNEILQNYGTASLYNLLMSVFDMLPICALIDNNVFAAHGGLSPLLPLIGMVQKEDRNAELPTIGPLADITWSDPDERVQQWLKNARGAGYLFGADQTKKFCHLNKVKLVLRSHQMAMEGYQWYFNDIEEEGGQLGRLLLVWSAPDYAYVSKNAATILQYGFQGQERVTLKRFDKNVERITNDPSNYSSPYFV